MSRAEVDADGAVSKTCEDIGKCRIDLPDGRGAYLDSLISVVP